MARAIKKQRFKTAHRWIIPAKPGSSRLFWAVSVYDTLDELNGQVRLWTEGTNLLPRSWLGGACLRFEVAAEPAFLGFVLFAKERLGVGVVAHEMLHAAVQTLNMEGKELTRRREERLALTTQHLVNEFWRKWYRYAAR